MASGFVSMGYGGGGTPSKLVFIIYWLIVNILTISGIVVIISMNPLVSLPLILLWIALNKTGYELYKLHSESRKWNKKE